MQLWLVQYGIRRPEAAAKSSSLKVMLEFSVPTAGICLVVFKFLTLGNGWLDRPTRGNGSFLVRTSPCRNGPLRPAGALELGEGLDHRGVNRVGDRDRLEQQLDPAVRHVRLLWS